VPQVFLVDNGSSMERHWGEVKFLLEVLIWRVLGYDSDGIELFFTDPKTTVCVGSNRKQRVESFLEAMHDARPTLESAQTELRPRLKEIMSTYNPRKPRTVIILTDGEWRGMPYEQDIEEWVTHILSEFARQESSASPWQWGFEELQPITFQFIAFGHSKIGKRRMTRLDDFMAQEGGQP